MNSGRVIEHFARTISAHAVLPYGGFSITRPILTMTSKVIPESFVFYLGMFSAIQSSLNKSEHKKPSITICKQNHV